MKGILLALFSFLVLLAAAILSVRSYRGRKYFYFFLAEFPFACLFFLLLHRVLPDNLGCLPPTWLEPSPLVDIGNGFLILLLLFHMMWDAAYAFVLTGFTSELFVRMRQGNQGGFSVEALVRAFGGDREVDDILEWRIPNLLNSRYVSAEGDHFRLTQRGKWIARFAFFLKRLFNMDVEG